MTGVLSSYSDIGNRITELNKVVFRMHGDLKVVQQIVMNDVQGTNDASKEGSSVLGKYIMGAKNNFKGFNGKQDEKNTPLKVTVHHREEGVDKEVEPGAAGESKYGSEGSDCDVVKMEEGRAQPKLENEENESKEVAETDKMNKPGNEVKEEVIAHTSSVQAEVTSEPTPGEANRVGKIAPGKAGGEKRPEQGSKQAESINESTGIKSTGNKFNYIELQETKKEAQWEKGRTTEHNAAVRSDVGDSDKGPGTKKDIPSPTGSSSSQDTGYGSREGEGSIDGVRVKPLL